MGFILQQTVSVGCRSRQEQTLEIVNGHPRQDEIPHLAAAALPFASSQFRFPLPFQNLFNSIHSIQYYWYYSIIPGWDWLPPPLPHLPSLPCLGSPFLPPPPPPAGSVTCCHTPTCPTAHPATLYPLPAFCLLPAFPACPAHTFYHTQQQTPFYLQPSYLPDSPPPSLPSFSLLPHHLPATTCTHTHTHPYTTPFLPPAPPACHYYCPWVPHHAPPSYTACPPTGIPHAVPTCLCPLPAHAICPTLTPPPPSHLLPACLPPSFGTFTFPSTLPCLPRQGQTPRQEQTPAQSWWWWVNSQVSLQTGGWRLPPLHLFPGGVPTLGWLIPNPTLELPIGCQVVGGDCNPCQFPSYSSHRPHRLGRHCSMVDPGPIDPMGNSQVGSGG